MRMSTAVGAGAVILSLALVPLAIQRIATFPAVVAHVEAECLPVPEPNWDGEQEFLAFWKALPEDGSTMPGFHAALLEGEAGPVRVAEARSYLELREREGLWYRSGPSDDPPGRDPVLARPIPAGILWTWPSPTRRSPVGVAWQLGAEAAALFLAGRGREGLDALEVAYRFTRIVGRGQHSTRDMLLVLGGIDAAHHLDRLVQVLLRTDLVAEDELGRLHSILEDDATLRVRPHHWLDRDLEFRRRAIRLVGSWLGPFAPIGDWYWGDSNRRIATIRYRFAQGNPMERSELAGAHPVFAFFLPNHGMALRSEASATRMRDRMLATLVHRRLAPGR